MYALVVARPNHPGLKPFTRDCDAIRVEREAAMKTGQPPAPISPTSGPACGYTWSSAIDSGGIPLAQLAGMLDWVAGRTIVDRTGLPGRYEFTLRLLQVATAPPSDAPTHRLSLHRAAGAARAQARCRPCPRQHAVSTTADEDGAGSHDSDRLKHDPDWCGAR